MSIILGGSDSANHKVKSIIYGDPNTLTNKKIKSVIYGGLDGLNHKIFSSGVLATLVETDVYYSGSAVGIAPIVTRDSTGLHLSCYGSGGSSGTSVGTAIFSIQLPSSVTFASASDIYIDSLVSNFVLTAGSYFTNPYLKTEFGSAISAANYDHLANPMLNCTLPQGVSGGAHSYTNTIIPQVGSAFTTSLVYFCVMFSLGMRSNGQTMQMTCDIPNGSIILAPNSLSVPVNFA